MHVAAARALRLAAVAALFLSYPAAAAFDAFLKLDGVPGESVDDKHRNEINVASWSFATAARGGNGRTCLSDITLEKHLDKASPLILGAAVSGAHFPTAVITTRQNTGAAAAGRDFLVITLKDVVITSISSAETTGADATLPVEQITLEFSSLTFSYTPVAVDGSVLPAVQSTVNGRC